jgi:ribosomal protein S18 acetylase RimI-like enzyme
MQRWNVVKFIIGIYCLLLGPSHAFQCNYNAVLSSSSKMNSSHSSYPGTVLRFYVREAKQTDLSQVADVLILSFTPEVNDPIRKMFEMMRLQANFPAPDDRHVFLVACESTGSEDGDRYSSEEKIIGFCKLDGRLRTDMHRTLCASFPQYENTLPQSPYATDLAVHPDYRRSGVGSAIMHAVELRAKSWGLKSLFLGVEMDNQSALSMYQGMRYENYIEAMTCNKNESVHILRRNLN